MRLPLALLAASLSLFPHLAGAAAKTPPAQPHSPLVLLPDLPAEPAPSVASQERRVYAGVYLSDVSSFDLKEGRFQADLEVWVKWEGDETPPQLVFLNGEVEKMEEVRREADGAWRSVRYRVQGPFRGTFPLQDFPFDAQTLRVQLALATSDATLMPDLASSGMASQFSITGWLYEPYFAAQIAPRKIASDLGSVLREGKPFEGSSVEFTVELERPFAAYLIKFLLPLTVILLMGVLSFFLPPDRLDVRASIAVTAVLSVVAFHFTQSDSLPAVSYLVVADKIFLVAYAAVFVILLATVSSSVLNASRPQVALRLDRTMRFAVPLASVILVSLVVSGPGATPAEPKPRPALQARPQPSPGGDELRIGTAMLSNLNSGGIPALLNRRLYVIGDRGEPLPHLVERVPSMTNSDVRFLPDGGMTVRWRLKRGLRWSDGAPLTADDLIYSLGLIENPSRRSVQRVDDRTLVIGYADRKPGWLTRFTVYPRHAAQRLSADGGLSAVTAAQREAPLPGTGPYRLVSFDPKEGAVLERNPYFAGQPPRIERVRIVPIGAGKVGEAFRAGRIHLVNSLSVESMAQIKDVPGIATMTELGDTLLFLQPDLSVKPLDQVEVRRAFLRAIDRTRIGKLMYGERMRLAHSYRPPEAADHVHDLPRTPHDPEGARALLARAGVTTPLELPLLSIEAPAGSSNHRMVAMLVEDFAAIGVKLVPRMLTGKALGEAATSGKHGGLLLSTRQDAEAPARFFNLPYLAVAQRYDATTPRPHFGAELVETNAWFNASLFVERKQVLSRRMQHAWAAQLPLLPIAFSVSQAAHVDTLRGYSPGAAETPLWNVESWYLGEREAPVAPAVAKDVP